MMNRSSMRRLLSVIGVLVLVAAMALSTAGCGSKAEEPKAPVNTEPAPQATTEANPPEETAAETQAAEAQGNVLGQGSTVFTFVAVDLEGVETVFEIHTDAATLGDVLLEQELIAGDMGEYGLYVKTVNGITLDWEKDGKYWSLLIDGEYAMTGVDATEIAAGTTYTFLPAE